MRWLIAIAIALIFAVPSAMATCYETVNAQEGNVVTLEMTPDGSYNYDWDLPATTPLIGYETKVPPYLETDRTVKVRIPALTACTDYVIDGYMASSLLSAADLGDCVDECTITIHACPVTCPPTDDKGEVCVTNWATKFPSDWTLAVSPTVGSAWTTGTKFTWTITETSDEVWSKTIGPNTDDNDIVIALADIDDDPVENAHPEKCFDVDVKVVDAAGSILLDTLADTTCGPIGKVCLVYDPTVSISGSVA